MKDDWLDPKEAARLMDENPDQVVFPLDYFIHRFGMTPDQVLSELRSGRLVAEARSGTMRRSKKSTVSASEFLISATALIDWMANPETPPHLVQAVKTTTKQS
jgi:hypothetical protein